MAIHLLHINTNNDQPIVQQIQSNLKRQILNRQLPPGSRLPSMRQISTQLGCSLGIVKQAVNMLTAEGYLRSSPRQGVYVADQSPAVSDIVMVMPNLELENMHQFAYGAREGLASSGSESYRLIIQAANNDYDEQLHLLEYLDPSLVAGVLICPPLIAKSWDALKKLQSRGFACIQLGAYLDGLNMGAVVFDAMEVAYQGLSHLLEMGHRRIGIIKTPDITGTGADLRAGLAMALKPMGLKLDQIPQVGPERWQLDADKPWYQGQLAATQLLTEHPGLTAILAVDAHMALGAVRAARKMGRKLGKDLSLVSLGDLSLFELLDTEITAIRKPYQRMAARAVLQLIKLINHEKSETATIQFAPRLIQRQSVARLT